MIAVPTASEITEQSLSTLVDLSRYPIDNSKPRVRAALVKSCQQQLAKTGCARLPAFLNPDARMAMVDEVDGRLSQVDRTSDWQNPYLSDDDESLPSEHPVRKFHYRKNAFLCRDRFAAGDWVDGLFERMELLNFVRDCLGLKQLYHYDDPMSGYLINIQETGETFPWHFDTNEFTISFMLKKSTGGGVFEYAPNIRNSENENYAAVTAVIGGHNEAVLALPLEAGDLQIFKGRYSLHRVTPVEGERSRYMAIFGYTDQPGVISKASRKLQLFGRCLDAHLEAEAQGVVRVDQLRD